jgi:hypothetical protein
MGVVELGGFLISLNGVPVYYVSSVNLCVLACDGAGEAENKQNTVSEWN